MILTCSNHQPLVETITKKNNNMSWRPNQKECDPTIWETFRQYLIHFIDMSYKMESLNFRSRPMVRMAWTFRTQELWALQLVVNGEGEMDLDSGVLLCKDQNGYEITIQIRWFVQKTGQFLLGSAGLWNLSLVPSQTSLSTMQHGSFQFCAIVLLFHPISSDFPFPTGHRPRPWQRTASGPWHWQS